MFDDILEIPEGEPERGIPGAIYAWQAHWNDRNGPATFHWDYIGKETFKLLVDNLPVMYLGNGKFLSMNGYKFFIYHKTYLEFDFWFKLVQVPE